MDSNFYQFSKFQLMSICGFRLPLRQKRNFIDFLYKIFSEGMSDDYPHLTKSIPMMMYEQISTFKSDLITLNQIKWHDDEYMVFEQKYLYKTVFDETIKIMNENRQNFSDQKFDSLDKSLQEIVVYCK